MIDITSEPLIRLSDAARLAGPGRGNRPTHLSTVLRWILDGVLTPNGERVRLEAIRVGSAWKTSTAAVQRFLAALTPRLDDQPTAAPRTPQMRQRAADVASRRLAEDGI